MDELDYKEPVYGPRINGVQSPRKRETFIKYEKRNTYAIDRDPKAFSIILGYLRNGQLPSNMSDRERDGVEVEASFFGLKDLKEQLRHCDSDDIRSAISENASSIEATIEREGEEIVKEMKEALKNMKSER